MGKRARRCRGWRRCAKSGGADIKEKPCTEKEQSFKNDCSFLSPVGVLVVFHEHSESDRRDVLSVPLAGIDYFQTHPSPMRILVCFRPLAGQ